MQVSGTLPHSALHMPGDRDPLFLLGGHETAAREETIPRTDATSQLTLINKTAYLTMWTAKHSIVADHIMCATGTSNRAPGTTLCRFGLYGVGDDGSATLLAKTASDTTLLTEMNTVYSSPIVADAAGNAIGSVALVRGQRYATGVIWCGTQTGPQLACATTTGAIMALTPVMARAVANLNDLPTSVAGTLPVGLAAMQYVALIPAPPSPVPGGFDLTGFFNNVGITSDINRGAGNFDGGGGSYSADNLALAGFVSGQAITYGGITFLWPYAAAGTADNVSATGQTIALGPFTAGTTLGILGAAVSGQNTGTAVVHYADGSTQSFALGLSDWTLAGGTVQPSYGNEIVATLPYRNNATGSDYSHPPMVFYAAVSLLGGLLVTGVTLPAQSNIHIFAMTVA